MLSDVIILMNPIIILLSKSVKYNTFILNLYASSCSPMVSL